MNENSIKVVSVITDDKTVICEYDIFGEWEKYFSEVRTMKVEYSEVIRDVPRGLVVIPFICNILPLVWLCDATVYVDELDQDFLQHIKDIKAGYKQMYPNFILQGKIVTNPVEYVGGKRNNVATLFSGGVDAYATLFSHLNENPMLVTVWGADIALEDEKGWNNVWKETCLVAEEYDLKPLYIKSEFRQILKTDLLDEFVNKSGDGWWHGFQHGIGILGNLAPLVGELGLSKIYIASSYPTNMLDKVTCASHPDIDENVHFAKCEVIHDGCDRNRQQKVEWIIENRRERKKKVNLRVCWRSTGGSNCCRCEKCYRTCLEIVSEGGNPNEFGFEWNSKTIEQCKRDFKNKIILQEFQVEQYYPIISQRIYENKDAISNYSQYIWLEKMNWKKFNKRFIKKIRHIVSTNKLVVKVWNRFYRGK